MQTLHLAIPKRKELSISARMANQLGQGTPTKSVNCFGRKSWSVCLHTFVQKSYSWPEELPVWEICFTQAGNGQESEEWNGFTSSLKMHLVFYG